MERSKLVFFFWKSYVVQETPVENKPKVMIDGYYVEDEDGSTSENDEEQSGSFRSRSNKPKYSSKKQTTETTKKRYITSFGVNTSDDERLEAVQLHLPSSSANKQKVEEKKTPNPSLSQTKSLKALLREPSPMSLYTGDKSRSLSKSPENFKPTRPSKKQSESELSEDEAINEYLMRKQSRFS